MCVSGSTCARVGHFASVMRAMGPITPRKRHIMRHDLQPMKDRQKARARSAGIQAAALGVYTPGTEGGGPCSACGAGSSAALQLTSASMMSEPSDRRWESPYRCQTWHESRKTTMKVPLVLVPSALGRHAVPSAPPRARTLAYPFLNSRQHVPFSHIRARYSCVHI